VAWAFGVIGSVLAVMMQHHHAWRIVIDKLIIIKRIGTRKKRFLVMRWTASSSVEFSESRIVW
jgi:hypothetical protein